MKFQPGQSGNPAGRPLGARNKKTIAREEKLAERAEEAVGRIVYLAGGGHPVAMRICAEWAKPGGNSRALALELPRITCADDAQQALDMVIEEFGRGAITVRELPSMLGSVDRMARVAERIQQNRERERERYGARRVHGLHPDMIPKAPPGWTDPYEALVAKIERGEDPFPDDPVKSAYVLAGEDLYSPVNPDASAREEEMPGETLAPSLPRAAGEGGSPERPAFAPCGSYGGSEVRHSAEREGGSEGEPGGGAQDGALYSPVNLNDEWAKESPPPGAADAAPPSPCGPCGGGTNGDDSLYFSVNSDQAPQSESGTDLEHEAISARDVEAASGPLASSLPRAAGEGGSPEQGEGEPGGGAANAPEGEVLYSPVNSNDESAGESPPPGAADAAPPSPCGGGMREPLNLKPG